MKERPKLKIALTIGDRLLEMVGWFTLLYLWLITLLDYTDLPGTIPIHFNGLGAPDSYGNKSFLFMLPILGTLLFIILTILNRFPHAFNYPVKITAENAEIQYRNVTRLLRYLKFSLVLTFSLIAYKTVETAKGKVDGLGTWFLPLSLAIIFVPLIYFVVKAFKANRQIRDAKYS